MAFSNVIFLFAFLPLTLGIYYLSKNEYKNLILLVASLLFYAYGEPQMVLLMIASIVCNYLFALGIERYRYKKQILVASILYNLGMLFVFKYLGFAVDIFNSVSGKGFRIPEIIMPIGISFYTFQALSYVIDVYNGRTAAQHNILNLGLYVSLFPQLVAGPIVRYNSIAEQIQQRNCTLELLGSGAKRFIRGFCKKIILANNLANVAEYYFTNQPAENSILGAWIGSICFSLQIFYDFSGYSDMAIGLGQMFGFEFEENFNYPYISKTVTEFWRRWHISLSKWFRDYVYIPLGGSRVSIPRNILNLAIVWLLTGIWHGASYSFIVWGIMYFVALAIEKYVVKPQTHENVVFGLLYRIAVLLYINFGWVIFNADGIKQGVRYWLSMAGAYYANPLTDTMVVRMMREYGVFLAAGILFATPVARCLADRLSKYKVVRLCIIPAFYIGGGAWAVSYLILGAHNPFIYFNF